MECPAGSVRDTNEAVNSCSCTGNTVTSSGSNTTDSPSVPCDGKLYIQLCVCVCVCVCVCMLVSRPSPSSVHNCVWGQLYKCVGEEALYMYICTCTCVCVCGFGG